VQSLLTLCKLTGAPANAAVTANIVGVCCQLLHVIVSWHYENIVFSTNLLLLLIMRIYVHNLRGGFRGISRNPF